MNDFELLNSDTPISDWEIDALESEVGIKFPLAFRDLYLSFNGGAPSREFWAEDEGYEPIRVEDFKSIARFESSDRQETKYIGGCFNVMTGKNVLPQHLVPFAVDEAGNFICLEKNGGQVVYFAVDVFQPDVDMYVNHVNAQKILSPSFEVFIQSLVDESEVDI
ncbi:hypothetical protein GLGCALEP_03370 [Pseudomonas sp. MM221]|nr:hypothetical protein GLGCALEP_03370 [Pseudomonas sp. MM221]